MVNPSITNSAGTIFTWNPGDIETINVTTSNVLDFDSMPGFTPDASLLYDFSGVTKKLTVSGVLSDTGNNTLSSGTAITVDAQRKWLEQLLNGLQSGSTFISNYTSTYNGSTWINSKILISSFMHNEDTNKPNVLSFSITLFVGDV